MGLGKYCAGLLRELEISVWDLRGIWKILCGPIVGFGNFRVPTVSVGSANLPVPFGDRNPLCSLENGKGRIGNSERLSFSLEKQDFLYRFFKVFFSKKKKKEKRFYPLSSDRFCTLDIPIK